MNRKMLATLACVIASASACAQSIAGTATEQKIDVSKLDTGAYRTEPQDYGNAEVRGMGEVVEAMRMAEATPDLASIDPKFFPWGSFPAPSAEAALIARSMSFTDTGEPLPVLRKNGMAAAFWITAMDSTVASDRRVFIDTLIRFPDSGSADRAASELEAADFAVSPDNVAVPIPKHPDAHAHWRPGIPSMSATLAHGVFVMHVVVRIPTPNINTMVGLVENVFGEQIAALDQFSPTPLDQLAALPRDEDGILHLTLDVTPDESRDDGVIGVYGPRGTSMQLAHGRESMSNAGADRMAVFLEDVDEGGAKVLRTRDDRAARDFVNGYAKENTDILKPIKNPEQLPTVRCFELKPEVYKTLPGMRYECYVRYGRYVAIVSGPNVSDMAQRAAAQYVLLTKG